MTELPVSEEWFRRCDSVISDVKWLSKELENHFINNASLELALDNISEAYGIAHSHGVVPHD
jgi:hypothetical protein